MLRIGIIIYYKYFVVKLVLGTLSKVKFFNFPENILLLTTVNDLICMLKFFSQDIFFFLQKYKKKMKM